MRKVMSNEEVVRAWALGRQPEARNAKGTLFFEGERLYSYGRHHLLALRHQHLWLINADRASVTTSRHASLARRYAPTYHEVPELHRLAAFIDNPPEGRQLVNRTIIGYVEQHALTLDLSTIAELLRLARVRSKTIPRRARRIQALAEKAKRLSDARDEIARARHSCSVIRRLAGMPRAEWAGFLRVFQPEHDRDAGAAAWKAEYRAKELSCHMHRAARADSPPLHARRKARLRIQALEALAAELRQRHDLYLDSRYLRAL